MSQALLQKLVEPGWTPSERDLPGLIELLASVEKTQGAVIERALLKRRDVVAAAIFAALNTAGPRVRVRLWRIAGHLLSLTEPSMPLIKAALDDLHHTDNPVRRQAGRALGNLRAHVELVGGELSAALLRPQTDDVRRALIEALGKLGGAPAQAALNALTVETAFDSDLLERARLSADRHEGRKASSSIHSMAKPEQAYRVWFHCRSGLASLLASELAERGESPRIVDATCVEIFSRAPFEAASASRLHHRMGFPLERGPASADGMAACVASQTTRELIATFTQGAARYRIDWQDGAHHRELTWKIIAAIASRAPELKNDPHKPTWQIRIAPGGAMELEPKEWLDPRFNYRVATVPAASHPTVAAALARMSRSFSQTDHEVVWDPFVGSGLELIELALASRATKCIGSDRDPRALAAAHANAVAAGVEIELTIADALAHKPEGITAILTNPPMGRRVRGDARSLMLAFVNHASLLLPPGGTLTWLSPFGQETAAAAKAVGFECAHAHSIDMGGFFAEIQVLVLGDFRSNRRALPRRTPRQADRRPRER